ncbi:hypothetical protein ACHWQZ_G010913 [Mnemiopsis leidyi]
MFIVLFILLVGVSATSDDWIAVERDVKINYDLENSPLQIKTDSVEGSDEKVRVYFFNVQDYDAGGVNLIFSSPPQYRLRDCSTTSSYTNFPTDIPTETNKVWTLTLSRVSGEIRVVITCNTVEVLNAVLSSTTCSVSDWSTYWSRDVEMIRFSSDASVYYRAGITSQLHAHWIAVERNVFINYDLENSPLQIKTDSVVGSVELVNVWFYTQDNGAGGVFLYFTSPPQYWLYYCSTSRTNFPTVLPTETNKVWTFTLSRVSGEIRVVITCNTVEVLNVVLSSTTCSDSSWSTYWSRDVEKILFNPSLDTASDYYNRAAPPPICTGLKAEWTSTIETTTVFPVDPGTVVTVTCSNSDAVNEGSSEVTCTKGTDFTFSTEPSCSIPECTGLKTTWTNMKADKNFPVPTGTVLSLSCNDGFELTGDKTVTCTQNTEFQVSVEPNCAPICTGLKTEWTSTMETTTQFPVDPGTVVTVTCSNSDAVNVGSSEVTCTKETDFTFSTEPSCSIPECTGLKTTWTDMKADKNFPVPTGTVLSLSCNDGFELTGDNTVTCTQNTEFQVSVEPNCECPKLEVNNAAVSQDGPLKVGNVVTVTCLKPLRFVLFGETYVTCQSTARWSEQPACKQCGNMATKQTVFLVTSGRKNGNVSFLQTPVIRVTS